MRAIVSNYQLNLLIIILITPLDYSSKKILEKLSY